MNRSSMARWVAGLIALPAVVVLSSTSAVAADGEVAVTNTETVQAYLDATGKVDVVRVYEQVAMQGTGTVNLRNPVQARGLRNLDGFGGFEVKDGNMVGSYEVDGERRLRSVSSYDKKLPLEISVKYFLDGKEVKPGDVVGSDGTLKVEYAVRNKTGTPQEISFDDGTGKVATSTEDVVIPMVGSLTTTLPPQFTDVRSDEANMAGDGRGGTKMTYTMTLFGPIGSPEATFGYEAEITNGVVPSAVISALPVSPLDSPSFKGGAQSYKGGAETGVQLTAGATEIDSNLLRLRDGASELLTGLLQLRDGADQLRAGLAGEAAPGAELLADGAGQAKDGSAQLADGAARAKEGSGQVADGAGQVADGAGQLDDGANQLSAGLDEAGAKAPALLDGLAQVADGLDRVDAGLLQLHGSIGTLPEKAKPLHDGIAKLRAGLGSKEASGTLINGVEQLRSQLAKAVSKGDSLDQLIGGTQRAKGGVDQVKAGVDEGLAPGGGIDQLQGGVTMARNADCLVVCKAILAQVLDGLTQLEERSTLASQGLGQVSTGMGEQLVPGLELLKERLGLAAGGLAQIECGLSNATLESCDPKKPGLLEGITLVDAGVSQLVDGVVTQVQAGVGDDDDLAADGTLRGGVHSLQGGVDQIGEGGATLLDGLSRLGDGASQLADGTGRLRTGAHTLADGAGQLDEGLGTLAGGAGQLDDGLGELRDGAQKLSTGLDAAADGSGKLADGLGTAADGAPKLRDGAQQLSDQGTSKLVVAGKATAADYGAKYALIEAGATRAKTEGMAYGAPAGAAGQTAYSMELAGADGEGGRNLARGFGAAGAFALAALAGLARRRFA